MSHLNFCAKINTSIMWTNRKYVANFGDVIIIICEALQVGSPKLHKFMVTIELTSSLCHMLWTHAHCSKSTFFVQKFNFDFPRKLSVFLGEKSWKCCDFGLFSCWQRWFHEKICQKNFGWKTRENVWVLSKLNFWTKIWLFE